jgi:hypothetical protein
MKASCRLLACGIFIFAAISAFPQAFRVAVSPKALFPIGPSENTSGVYRPLYEVSFGVDASLSFPISPILDTQLTVGYLHMKPRALPSINVPSVEAGLTFRIPFDERNYSMVIADVGYYQLTFGQIDGGNFVYDAGLGLGRKLLPDVELFCKALFSDFLGSLEPVLYSIQLSIGAAIAL